MTDGFNWDSGSFPPNKNIEFFDYVSKKNPDFDFFALDWKNLSDDGLVKSINLTTNSYELLNVSDLDLFHVLFLGNAADDWQTLRSDLDIVQFLDVPIINHPETINYFIDKQYLLDLQDELPIIKTASIPSSVSLAELKDFAGDTYSIVKPLNGEKGYLVNKLEDITDSIMDDYRALTLTLLLQPLMEGISQGEDHLIFLGDRFSHAAKKTPAKGNFKINTGSGSIPSAYSPTKEELDLGFEIKNKVKQPLTIYRVDLVASSEGPKIMEIEAVNPSFHAGTISINNVQAERLGQFYKEYFNGDLK